MTNETKTYLNLGCGKRYLKDWTNIDFVSSGEGVKAHNLLNGIPHPNESFDVVYHSHVLEHFPRQQAEAFLRECFRVLKKGGVVRVVVPNLEQIARIYLEQLNKVRSNPTPYNKANYEWSVIEMYDQTVRNYSGGAMAEFWSDRNMLNEDWIIARHGNEYVDFKSGLGTTNPSEPSPQVSKKWKRFLKFSTYRNRLLTWLSGDPKLHELLELARFRTGGEVHQWMYDSYSLGELLKKVGFKEPREVDAFTSSITDWPRHQWLDVDDNNVRKPDSLFMEAIK